MAIAFTKGHGTQNDFILIDDPDGDLTLDAGTVARLSDRRQGLGADGVIRVIRTAALLRFSGPDSDPGSGGSDPAAGVPATVSALPDADRPEWFMDYRNADGSVAQMCGNGVRVFAAHLIARGWIDLPDGGEFRIGTRSGVKTVGRSRDWFGVDLGPWRLPGGMTAIAAGADARVSVPSMPATAPEPVLLTDMPGLSVNLGNPHVVVALPSLDLLESLDLTRHPGVEPMPFEGVNVEFVVPMHDSSATGEGSGTGHLTMRVFERGVGETRSCGTGAVAAVLAARAWAGADAPAHWTVDVPGGRLEIDVPVDVPAGPDGGPAGGHAAGESVILSGPAVLVADGHLLGL